MNERQKKLQEYMPAAENVARELRTARSIDDFFGKEGIFSRLFGKTIESIVEAELTDHLGYEKHSSAGDHNGNSRNGSYSRKIRSSAGETEISVARDREGEFSSTLLKKYQTSSNEIEDKVVMMYARGMTVSDIQDTLMEMYGIDLSPTLISTITAKVMPLVEQWHSRALESIYTIMYIKTLLRDDRRIIKKLKIGGSDFLVSFAHLGTEERESFVEGGIIFINRDHKLFKQLENKTELAYYHLIRLVSQELVKFAQPRTVDIAFDWQAKLIKDAYGGGNQ